MISRDFQCAILTETGDVMFLGPFLMYLGNTLGIMTKWILENRSESPGIEDGDVFLCSDPYVGSSHQQDTGLTSPVFWEGELFCWVANCVHYSDVGGPAPGSFCLESTNIWEDPPLFPPMKLAERGNRPHRHGATVPAPVAGAGHRRRWIFTPPSRALRSPANASLSSSSATAPER